MENFDETIYNLLAETEALETAYILGDTKAFMLALVKIGDYRKLLRQHEYVNKNTFKVIYDKN